MLKYVVTLFMGDILCYLKVILVPYSSTRASFCLVGLEIPRRQEESWKYNCIILLGHKDIYSLNLERNGDAQTCFAVYFESCSSHTYITV